MVNLNIELEMENKMSDDNQIIKEMYRGEEQRDASSKIRGFLFQDLVAISKLLDEDTIYVIPEYVEDVLVYTKEQTYIIQAKYYPQGNIQSKYRDIIRDLYYQYLRLEIKKYAGKVIPVLAVYSPQKLGKPSLQELRSEKYLNIKRSRTKARSIKNVEEWLDKDVYSQNKEAAADKLFKTFASNTSINNFRKMYNIKSDYKKIEEYREEISDQLNKIQLEGCVIDDDEKRKAVLLGLSVQYIQERYNENMGGEENFERRKCKRTELIEYLKSIMCNDTERSIGAYLRSVVIECWEQIVTDNTDIDENESNILECIRDNTAQWFFELGSKMEGQKKLLNTVSLDAQNKIKNYCTSTLTQRLNVMCEHRRNISDFLKYLWKIMIDINSDMLNDKVEMDENDRKRLMPKTYINDRKDYISFNFHNDNRKDEVILASISGSTPKSYVTNIFNRMMEFQPEKWFMQGEYKGEYLYSMDVSQIINPHKNGYTVSDIDSKKFRIECMKCIDVDIDGWKNIEDCKECIFSNECKDK